MKRLRLFRGIAFVEGVTTLALFLVAMPMKYWLGDDSLIRPVGMTHGVAWLAYLAAMVALLPGTGLRALDYLRTFVASLFPFGTFLNDPLLRRRKEEYLAARA